MEAVKVTFSWIVAILVGLIGLVIVFKMLTGKIDLQRLISEGDGKGSMVRLQFLIFTFVIAGSFFLITVSSNPPAFPSKIPGEVLALLGISGGSYVLGKGGSRRRRTPNSPAGTQRWSASVFCQPSDSTCQVLRPQSHPRRSARPLLNLEWRWRG